LRAQAKQSGVPGKYLDCFVAYTPLRKRFAFVAGNDGSTVQLGAITLLKPDPISVLFLLSMKQVRSAF
jgi:hypothetical protein